MNYYDRLPAEIRVEEDENDDAWLESDELLDLRRDAVRIEGESPNEWLDVDSAAAVDIDEWR